MRLPRAARFIPGVALAVLATLGCAARASVVREKPAGVVERPGGPDLAVLPRPTDAVRLSLWIDAGSRDGDPPQVATLAAWTAGDTAGPEVEAWVTPDATEFSTPCRRAELARCATRLARALAVRKVDPNALGRARARLEAGRRLAIARDPGRGADALALRALLGDGGARGFVPLGEPDDDAAVTPAAIGAFLQAHFGPTRALLVAAGDVDIESVEAAVRGGFAALPAAERERATRANDVDGGIRVAVDDATHVTIAIASPDERAAASRAQALGHALARSPTSAPLVAHAFAVRGGALALARVDRDIDADRLDAIIAQTARHHASEDASDRSSVQGDRDRHEGDDLREASRYVAFAWATRGEATLPPAIGVGVLVAAGRTRADASAGEEDALRDATTQRLERAWHDALAAVEPEQATLGDARAALRLPNGARVETAWRPGANVAVTLRFRPGAAHDPPLAHGRTATLAALVATCARRPGHALRPLVDAGSWGVSLVVPHVEWSVALDRVLDCALDPSFAPADLVAARLALRGAVGRNASPRALRAEAARLIAPASPGQVAPWGSARGIAGATDDDVRDLWRRSVAGAHAALALVGEVPMRQALDHATRRLTTLRAGAPEPPAPVRSVVSTPEGSARVPIGPERVVVTWRDEGAIRDAAGAWAFGAALRAAIASEAGVVAEFHDGGNEAGFAWASVTIEVEPSALGDLDRRLREAQGRLDGATLTRAVERTWIVAERRYADSAASLDHEADRLAQTALGVAEPVRSREAALALARRLARSEPRWSIAPR
jgi:predicted Zn-dependent peptidase